MSIKLDKDGKAINPEDIGKHDIVKIVAMVGVVIALSLCYKLFF